MARDGLTMAANIDVTQRSLDFVSQFSYRLSMLMDILGITNLVEKTPGTILRSYTTTIDLQDGHVAEGEAVPRSPVTTTEYHHKDLEVLRYSTEITEKAVTKYGADVAVDRADVALLRKLQNNILNNVLTELKSGTLKGTESDLQMAFAMSIGMCKDKFESLDLTANEIVTFMSTLDFYRYLGSKDIQTQTQFGMTYLQDFLGARKVILSNKIDRGTVISTPADNLVGYYINPTNSHWAKLGLNYVVDGDTPFVGFHSKGDYEHNSGINYAIMGVEFWPEYADGIAVVSFGNGASTASTVSTQSETTTAQQTKAAKTTPKE